MLNQVRDTTIRVQKVTILEDDLTPKVEIKDTKGNVFFDYYSVTARDRNKYYERAVYDIKYNDADHIIEKKCVRPAVVDKLFVEDEHFGPHWDDDCDCYSFQKPCELCTLKRAAYYNNMDMCPFLDYKQNIVIRVDGMIYTPNKSVKDWFSSMHRIVRLGHYIQDQVVLLFMSDGTVDLRHVDQ